MKTGWTITAMSWKEADRKLRDGSGPPPNRDCRAQIKLAEIYAEESEIADRSVKACGWFLLETMTLSGGQLEQAQSAYRRASSRLAPAQIAAARHFADAWEPKSTTAAASSDQPLFPEEKRA